MEAHAEHTHGHSHHEIPSGGTALTGVAISATLHCLTGCAIGEVSGMAIGTALGFSNFATIALAVTLAFIFGYTLTSLPLLKAGLALSTVVPIALAADTLSIATMEVIDNAIMLAVPGAMHAGLDSVLFWGSLSFALAVAFVLTVPVNRWLLTRGKGHTAIHETGIHGGPSPKLVGAAVIVAFIFGTTVVAAEVFGSDDDAGHGMEGHTAAATSEHGGAEMVLASSTLSAGSEEEIRFQVVGSDGVPITDFDVEHTKPMHLIVVRRDLSDFQHLHPRMSTDGTWTASITLPEDGTYRAFADFSHEGESQTAAVDVTAGHHHAEDVPLPPASPTASAGGGYKVELAEAAPVAGAESELAFRVTRNGEPVAVEPYLGANGHLVALSEGDLEFLHVHPLDGDGDEPIAFMTEFTEAGRHALFLQFRDAGKVRTASFTLDVD